jgi:hypothetical protein
MPLERSVLENDVAPEPVQTRLTMGFTTAARLPLGRMGRREELDCAPAANHVSGPILDVNGGAFVG